MSFLCMAISMQFAVLTEARPFSSCSLRRRRSCQAILSAAGFRLRYQTADLFNLYAHDGAEETTLPIVNVNLRNRVNVVLPRHRCVPINDVDLAQRNLRVGLCHLLQAWGDSSTRAA